MTPADTLQVIYEALALARDTRIDDVTNDTDGEILLTTTEGDKKQAWIVSAASITETRAVD